jgi:hypothetical protein
LWLTGGSEAKFEFGKWTTYGAAGLIYLTEGKVLPDQQKNWAGFGTLGLGWQTPLSWLALKVQADAHTPFYRDSELKEMGAHSVQLVAGGTIYLSGKTSLDIGVGYGAAFSKQKIFLLISPDTAPLLSEYGRPDIMIATAPNRILALPCCANSIDIQRS